MKIPSIYTFILFSILFSCKVEDNVTTQEIPKPKIKTIEYVGISGSNKDLAGTYTFSYDKDGKLISQTNKYNSLYQSNNFSTETTTFSYNSEGKITGINNYLGQTIKIYYTNNFPTKITFIHPQRNNGKETSIDVIKTENSINYKTSDFCLFENNFIQNNIISWTSGCYKDLDNGVAMYNLNVENPFYTIYGELSILNLRPFEQIFGGFTQPFIDIFASKNIASEIVNNNGKKIQTISTELTNGLATKITVEYNHTFDLGGGFKIPFIGKYDLIISYF
jgi:YD repeat-containing protein